MAITPKSESKSVAVYNCCKCKEHYDSLTQFFKSNSNLYANTGYLPICKKCLLELFNQYIEKYGDTEKAMQRTCMAFDLYYNKSLFDTCDNGTEATLGNYIKRLNMVQYKNKTFETSIDEGFVFGETKEKINPTKIEDDESSDEQISKKDIKKWGIGFEATDYQTLNTHYEYLKAANPNCDSNQEIFINDLCYTHMQKMKALRDGDVDAYNKLTDSYRKSFKQAGLKTEQEAANNADAAWGLMIKDVSQYTVEEYYMDKLLYKDMDGLDEYFQRHCGRPLKNTKYGTQDRDAVYYVHEEDDDDGDS